MVGESIYEALINMKFDSKRVENALKSINDDDLLAALDQLISHTNLNLPSSSELEAVDNNVNEGDHIIPSVELMKSYDGKLFSKETDVQCHATKVRHLNLSKSLEEGKPLTDEEKRIKMEKPQEEELICQAKLLKINNNPEPELENDILELNAIDDRKNILKNDYDELLEKHEKIINEQETYVQQIENYKIRISNLEKKCNDVIREKDRIKTLLEELEKLNYDKVYYIVGKYERQLVDLEKELKKRFNEQIIILQKEYEKKLKMLKDYYIFCCRQYERYINARERLMAKKMAEKDEIELKFHELTERFCSMETDLHENLMLSERYENELQTLKAKVTKAESDY